MGYLTGKVLYMSVKNKFCFSCAVAEGKGEKPSPDHTCYKNYASNQSSASMESAIIAEGFCKSVEMYGVKYHVIIGDGDCCVHNKVVELNPYPNIVVIKIECKNHLLRNLSSKFKNIEKNSALKHVEIRKLIYARDMDFRTAITSAMDFRIVEKGADGKLLPKQERITNLMRDILNSPHHMFGDHGKCATYFCTGPKQNEVNLIPKIKTTAPFVQLEKHIKYVANRSRSLIEDVTSNIVEQVFSIVAKYVGGKRVNVAYTYNARCSAAVINHNTGGKLHYKAHKKLCGVSPGDFAKAGEARKSKKVDLARQRREERAASGTRTTKKKKLFSAKSSKHGYWPDRMTDPLSPEEYEEKKEEFLLALKKTPQQKIDLEQRTRLEEFIKEWQAERKKMCTASNFGKICTRMSHTPCDNLLKYMMYSDGLTTCGMEYGKLHEPDAIAALSLVLGLAITKCGLQIDELLDFVGATTDGRVAPPDNGIVEVKCHEKAEGMTPDEAVKKRVSKFWKYDKKTDTIGGININDHYYYQVQGQLHVTQATHCYFAIWTNVAPFIKYVRIERDDVFWRDRMEKKITMFYVDCMLPEIIDPQLKYNLPAKNPPYILAAMKEKEQRDIQRQSAQANKPPAKRGRKRRISSESDNEVNEPQQPQPQAKKVPAKRVRKKKIRSGSGDDEFVDVNMTGVNLLDL